MLCSLIQGFESSGRFTNRMPGLLTTVEVKNSVWFHDCVSAAHFFLRRLVFCSPTLNRLSSSRALNRKGTRVQSRENGEQRGCKFTVPKGTPMAESPDQNLGCTAKTPRGACIGLRRTGAPKAWFCLQRMGAGLNHSPFMNNQGRTN
jgi:hypothetical protein